jgi:hypothetical protein
VGGRPWRPPWEHSDPDARPISPYDTDLLAIYSIILKITGPPSPVIPFPELLIKKSFIRVRHDGVLL